jgi:hypothetical protein
MSEFCLGAPAHLSSLEFADETIVSEKYTRIEYACGTLYDWQFKPMLAVRAFQYNSWIYILSGKVVKVKIVKSGFS